MTDLETACRELVAEWREYANNTPETVCGNVEYRVYHEVANELSCTLKEHTDSDVEQLVEEMEDAT